MWRSTAIFVFRAVALSTGSPGASRPPACSSLGGLVAARRLGVDTRTTVALPALHVGGRAARRGRSLGAGVPRAPHRRRRLPRSRPRASPSAIACASANPRPPRWPDAARGPARPASHRTREFVARASRSRPGATFDRAVGYRADRGAERVVAANEPEQPLPALPPRGRGGGAATPAPRAASSRAA